VRASLALEGGVVDDEPTNRNNRFAVAALLNARCGGQGGGPLWGCPPGADLALPTLRPTSPGYPYRVRAGLSLARLRLTDALKPRVQPVWKLYGRGSVGSQTLLGLPALCRLRDDAELAAISRVWPFETGFTLAGLASMMPLVVHAEIWPGLVPLPPDGAPSVRDQAQVRAVTGLLAALDRAGTLGALFGPPPGQPDAALATAVREEGWILGAGHASRPAR
jgi:precorrin-8X/cobalt-precorrin-8 methylmutase